MLKDIPRETALTILCRTEEGIFADTALALARQKLDARDSAFLLELVYGTLRNRSLLDWTLNRFSAKPVDTTDAWTRNILRLAAYQMLFLDRVPVSAAVNTAVELAKAHGNKHGYVNGLLRGLDRKRSTIGQPDHADPVMRLAIQYSHPLWLVKRWVARFGTEIAESVLRANNLPAPLTIRTNTLRTTRQALRAALEAEGVALAETDHAPAGLNILATPQWLRTLQAYRDGWFVVQDQAAQLISLLLSPQPGDTVLDACAAPGGKTTHLAELMQDRGTVVALELDASRMVKIRENSRRLGLTSIATVQGDATAYQVGSYDRVLVDAPCSGLGVLRRHPDGRWNKTEQTVDEHGKLQRRILQNCSALLKPGGTLVYATCTTEPAENDDVIDWFLGGPGNTFTIDDPRPLLPQAAAALVDSRGFFRTVPNAPAMDGFFGVRMVKKT
ncbi:MAG: 16S rRNA (cytosine(967)-C(5))-methyltransferase [Nitrospirae bacterium GWC2_56_14]|nr:MAG: 16S rRNA (cytosine(967)-C(5))-methyltransferase [Nitrospirae bacterium GWC2_56_14]